MADLCRYVDNADQVEERVSNFLNELFDVVSKNLLTEHSNDATETTAVNCQALVALDAGGNRNRPSSTGICFQPISGPRPVFKIMLNLPTLGVFKMSIDGNGLTNAASNGKQLMPPLSTLANETKPANILSATVASKGSDTVLPQRLASGNTWAADFVDNAETQPRLRVDGKEDLNSFTDIGQVSIVSELLLLVSQIPAKREFVRVLHLSIIEYYKKQHGRCFTPKPVAPGQLIRCFWESMNFLSRLSRRTEAQGPSILNELFEKFCKLYILQRHICIDCGLTMRTGKRIQCCGLYAHARKILEREHLKLFAVREEFLRLRRQFTSLMKLEVREVEYAERYDVLRRLIDQLNACKPDLFGIGLDDNHKLFFYNEFMLQMKRLHDGLRQLEDEMRVGLPKKCFDFDEFAVPPPVYNFFSPHQTNAKAASTSGWAANASVHDLRAAINPEVLKAWTSNLDAFKNVDMELDAKLWDKQLAHQINPGELRYEPRDKVSNLVAPEYENSSSYTDNDITSDLLALHFDDSFEF